MNNVKHKLILFCIVIVLSVITLGISICNTIRIEKIYDIVVNLQYISSKEVEIVNDYTRELGLKPYSKEIAESISHMGIYYNEQTKETKNQWELIVDFVNSDEKEKLGYEVVFDTNPDSVKIIGLENLINSLYLEN